MREIKYALQTGIAGEFVVLRRGMREGAKVAPIIGSAAENSH